MDRYKQLLKVQTHQNQPYPQQQEIKVDNWVNDKEQQKVVETKINTPPGRPIDDVPVKDHKKIDLCSVTQNPESEPQYLAQIEKVTRSKHRVKVKVNEKDIFGDLHEQRRGRKHFVVTSKEDQVAHILEHPLSHYTNT